MALLLPLTAPVSAEPDRPGVADRLYVLDCGTATSPDLSQWTPGSHQGRPIVYADHCYLIRHGRDWMLWDTGVDDRLAGLPRGKEIAHKVTGIAGPGLVAQLTQLGISPDDITIIAFSHAHFDHVGNARLFPKARWLVQGAEFNAMFGAEPAKFGFIPELYGSLRNNPTDRLDGDRDVFGDGSVRIIATPGHTPGHQSLLVRLARRGSVLLSGDAAHTLENFELRRAPSFNADTQATRRSIEKIDRLLVATPAELWVNHDRLQTKEIPLAPDPVD
jgi:N-acyl homoserine lactone hydrolase